MLNMSGKKKTSNNNKKNSEITEIETHRRSYTYHGRKFAITLDGAGESNYFTVSI